MTKMLSNYAIHITNNNLRVSTRLTSTKLDMCIDTSNF